MADTFTTPITLETLLQRFDSVETESDGYLVHCPAHADSRPSLRLAVSAAGKVLMRCRAGCSSDAVLKALTLSSRDLAQMTAGDVSVPRATSTNAPASPAAVAALAVRLDAYAEALSPTNQAGLAEDARAYAASRFGLGDDEITRFGLGVADDLGGGARLVVPFRDRRGVARGFQARALDADAQVRWLGPKSPEGESWARTGFFPGAGGYDEVLVVEGPSDALTAAVRLGFDAVAVRGAGLSANPAVVEELVAQLDGREAVLVGDGDPSGHRFNATLAEALSARDLAVRAVTVPEGKDLSDWVTDLGPKATYEILRAIADAPAVKSRSAALLAWDEERYSLTDLGGARYLRDYLETQGSGVRYTEEAGFYVLRDGVWHQDEQQQIRTYAQAVADLVRGLADAAVAIAATDGASKEEKARAARLKNFAAYAQASRGISAILRELQAVSGVACSINDFDQHPDLLAVKNGVVDLRSGKLRPHDPALLLTRCIDVEYKPGAKAPRWDRFLEEIFPNGANLPAYLRRLVGYGITGHTAEQCFAVLYGTGANGKSVLTDTLTEVFRPSTTTTPFSTFEEKQNGGIPNDIAALKGARLVFASEGDQGKPMAEAQLKRLTGHDVISARFMRREFFEFRPSFLILLATNFKPSFKGQDEGLWRRVKLIPFDRYFAVDERDHRLGEKLLAEAEGILAWAVRGAQEWYAGGLQDPEEIRGATAEFRATSDALAGFLPGVWVRDMKAPRVNGKELFDSYLEWADEENLPAKERWTRRAFYAALEERGMAKRDSNKGVAFDGIRRRLPSDIAGDAAVTAPTTEPAPTPPVAANAPIPAPQLFGGANLDDVL